MGLHFSGHGFQNKEALYKDDKKTWLKYKKNGDVLIFENDQGTSEFFFEQDLVKMLSGVRAQLKILKEKEK